MVGTITDADRRLMAEVKRAPEAYERLKAKAIWEQRTMFSVLIEWGHPNTWESNGNETQNPHRGSSFEEFLREDGIYEEVTAKATERVSAYVDGEAVDPDDAPATTVSPDLPSLDLPHELRKRAECVFLATEADIAQDLSDHRRHAADEIERLGKRLADSQRKLALALTGPELEESPCEVEERASTSHDCSLYDPCHLVTELREELFGFQKQFRFCCEHGGTATPPGPDYCPRCVDALQARASILVAENVKLKENIE